MAEWRSWRKPVSQTDQRPVPLDQRENILRAQDIQAELSKHLKATDVPNLTVLGKALKNLKWPRGGNNGVRGYYLTLREEENVKL